MSAKVVITAAEASAYAAGRRGRLIGYDFAADGHPASGIAYWRYFVVRVGPVLHIVEAAPKGDELEFVLGVVS